MAAPKGNDYAKGNKGGGAPRIYDAEDLAEKLHDYIDSVNDPRIEEFCLPREMCSMVHLYELAKECKSLSNAISRAKMKRNIYLTGENCNIHPKVIGIRLCTDQGMTEKLQTEITGKDGGAVEINVNIVDE